MTFIKEFFELAYWKGVRILKGKLSHDHYEFFFTEYFGISSSYYQDKVILDIGCGPRGSLEWAHMTKKRIGLDPLADKYMKMGADKHKMEYVKAYVEHMPFPDDHFDVITSFNSLDHVADLQQACQEIIRVLKPGGRFLLAVDIHQYPTLTEPQTISWELIEKYFISLRIIQKRRLEIVAKHKIYENLRQAKRKNEADISDGILTAILEKNR
jgi:ubiquinone/menaquinone biosynthesis C-methylase UbiE